MQADSLRFYKLHGSINWFYSGPEGRDESVYDAAFRAEWIPDSPGEVAARVGGLVPLVMPPVLAKDPYFDSDRLKEQWLLAGRAIRSATRLVLVGYSLPGTDQVMRFFLGTADSVKEVVVVNSSKETVNSARAVFKKSAVNAQFAGRRNAVREFVDVYTTV